MDTEIEIWHPMLKGKNYKIISTDKVLGDFNCFAYVIDIYDKWCGSFTKYWPYETISRVPILENYIKYFETFGYEICENDKYEVGVS